MFRRRTGTAIKLVLGFLLGAALSYHAFENLTAPGWTDSAKAAIDDCASRGLGARLILRDDVVEDVECVALDETEASRSDP